jgi:hypothetical protein
MFNLTQSKRSVNTDFGEYAMQRTKWKFSKFPNSKILLRWGWEIGTQANFIDALITK